VQIKFFAGGVMGNDKSVLRKVRVGQLHGGAFTVGSLSEVTPDANLFSLPLVFRNYDEVDRVRQRMDGELKAELEKAGFACFGFAEGGFALLMSERPVRTVAEVRGRKIWVPEGDTVSYRAMESLGLAPVTLPITDVMTGLQAGLVEIIVSSPIGALAFQWHTRVRYVTTTPLSYLYGTLVIDRKVFDKLAAADQQLLREVMERIYANLDRQNRLDNQAAAAAMAKQGIQFIDPPAAEVASWQAIAGKLVDDLRREGAFSPVLYDRMQSILAEARRDGSGAAGR
jgi:TRAP-type C4-dicarboxylate transport system substrate-binding protein